MAIISVAYTITLGLIVLLFVGAGVMHFTKMSSFYAAIVPKQLPNPVALVQLTGVLEVLGGIGLLIPQTSRLAGIGLMLFLVAVFPANVEAARANIPFSNPLWLRALLQLVLIVLIAWLSFGR